MSNNLVRVDYYAALFSLNSPLWHRSESCILKLLGYTPKYLEVTWGWQFPFCLHEPKAFAMSQVGGFPNRV
ncbi:hypothetical protein [Vibrio caribbeanicus]|uniref:hypothetical protein n=1 Tax=Vibrio caribbeanicus TaxID=701175 RepID=UPI000A30EB2E